MNICNMICNMITLTKHTGVSVVVTIAFGKERTNAADGRIFHWESNLGVNAPLTNHPESVLSRKKTVLHHAHSYLETNSQANALPGSLCNSW